MKKNLAISILIIMEFIHFGASSQDIKFDHYTIEQGLSNNVVKCIYQDSRGYIWFGTEDGLNKYDGYSFTIYRPKLDDSTSLSDNIINSIIEDHKGNLWVGTYAGGLNKFNYATEKFKRYTFNLKSKNSLTQNGILQFFEDKDQLFWIYGQNVYQYITRADTFKLLDIKLDTPNTIIRFFYQGNDKLLWLGTNNGLYNYNLKDNNYKCYKPKPGDKDILSNSITTLVEDPGGIFWLGSNRGLYKFDKKSGQFIYNLQINPEDGINGIISRTDIPSIINDNKYLWVSWQSWKNKTSGISKINKETKTYTTYCKYYTISDIAPINLFEDKSGAIWIGTYFGGIYKFVKENKFVTEMNGTNIVSFMEDHNKTLWVGTSKKGLYKFDSKNNTFINVSLMGKNPVNAMYEDNKGAIWVCSYEGIYRSITIKTDEVAFERLIQSPVKSIVEDLQHRMWMGFDSYLCLYYPDSKKIVEFRNEPNNRNSISNNSIETLLLDSINGNIWVGSWDGLNRLELPKKHDITPGDVKITILKHDSKNLNSLSENRIISLCKAKNGVLWAGTCGSGINRIEIKRLGNKTIYNIKRYSVENGLPNNVVYGILEDSHGNIWMSTNKGLSKFDPVNEDFVNYDISDGLQDNEYHWRSYCKGKSGKMYFGGLNGFNAFYPDSIKTNKYLPPVYITGFSIFNKLQIPCAPKSVLTKQINETKEITINYKQSVISFDYVGLNYIASQKNMYAYKMEGFDKDWLYVGNQRKATYTNLEPGTYVFRVKASNNDGIWNEEGTSLILNIKPPFWKTWWFYALSVVVIIGSIVIYVQVKTYNIKKHKIQLEKLIEEKTHELHNANAILEERQEEISTQNEKIIKQNDQLEKYSNNLEKMVQERTAELEKAKIKAEESDKLKSTFLANMSHEIRTPLNAIVGFSGILGQSDLTDQERQESVKIINKSTESLLVLINDILDLSIIEANQLKLNIGVFSVSDLLEELFSYWHLYLNSNFNSNGNIELKVAYSNFEDIRLFSDKSRLKQILSNFISNAIKFTESGSIEIGFNINGNEAIFHVKDTGIGISEENIQKLFKRFSKIEDNNRKLFRGIGLGLVISKRLSELLNGKLWVESKPGQGSIFYISVPIIEISEKVKDVIPTQLRQKNLDFVNKSILIVEDEETNFNYLKAILKRTNIDVHWAVNGLEALQLVQAFKNFDLIFMDIKMPIMDGYSALKEIRKISPLQVVVAQTAYVMADDVKEIHEAGFNDYLPKPFTADIFLKILNKYL